MDNKKPVIGFIGLGYMGQGMAAKLFLTMASSS